MAVTTDEEIAAARKAGEDVGPCAIAAYYFADRSLGVELDNGVMLRVPVSLIQGLGEAGERRGARGDRDFAGRLESALPGNRCGRLCPVALSRDLRLVRMDARAGQPHVAGQGGRSTRERQEGRPAA